MTSEERPKIFGGWNLTGWNMSAATTEKTWQQLRKFTLDKAEVQPEQYKNWSNTFELISISYNPQISSRRLGKVLQNILTSFQIAFWKTVNF